MKIAPFLIATVAIAVATVAAGTMASGSHVLDQRPAPIQTSAQLAGRIRDHDLKALGGSGAFGPWVHVRCRSVTPHGRLAGQFDHRCRETAIQGLCTSGGRYVDVLLIDVHGPGYDTFSDQQVSASDCILSM